MTLTQFEKIEQRRLKKLGANLYQIDVENEKTKETIDIELFAESQENALLLARRISKRSERNLFKDLNFDFREIKQNKLGLIFPWKDPVNIRSVDKAININLKRSKSMIRDIVSATNGNNQIDVNELSDNNLQKMKTANVKNKFVSLLCFVIGLYLFFNGSSHLSTGLCLVFSLITYIKTRNAEQIIKQVEITREHIGTQR
ncbi:MAG: hypothetical protein ACJAXJ_001174 [Colwellia sp.]|jgi:hypothetical protein